MYSLLPLVSDPKEKKRVRVDYSIDVSELFFKVCEHYSVWRAWTAWRLAQNTAEALGLVAADLIEAVDARPHLLENLGLSREEFDYYLSRW